MLFLGLSSEIHSIHLEAARSSSRVGALRSYTLWPSLPSMCRCARLATLHRTQQATLELCLNFPSRLCVPLDDLFAFCHFFKCPNERSRYVFPSFSIPLWRVICGLVFWLVRTLDGEVKLNFSFDISLLFHMSGFRPVTRRVFP
jgi:hypothetical protein